MVKKEDRLSPRARGLLESARKKFAHDPIKAIDYLSSVPLGELNMYDRQKIGREILARIKTSGYSPDYSERIEEKYGITTGKRKAEEQAGAYSPGRSYRRLESRKEAELDYKSAEKEEKRGESNRAYVQYWTAGKGYEKSGSINKALECYKKAQEVLKRVKVRHPQGEEILEKNIARVERLRAKIERRKPSRLETATMATAISCSLIGLFFLSTNITGNAIADLSTKTTSFLGIGLLIVGLVAGFFWLKSRKK